MLPPDQSPIAILINKWRKSRLAKPSEINACRSALLTAAVREIAASAEAGGSYNPMCDHRFIWGYQWIDVADGIRQTVDPDVDLCCKLSLDPNPILSGKDLAAGD